MMHMREIFPQQQPARHHSDEGSGIEVVVGDDHAQPLEGDVPDGEAHGVAEHSQKQPVTRILGWVNRGVRLGRPSVSSTSGRGGQEGPQKHPAGPRKLS